MARLNTNLSPTPGRSSSLYRDPTPLSQIRANSTRASTYSVLSPAESNPSSDKENHDFGTRDSTPQATASKSRRQMAPPRIPTPASGSSSSGRANKRRRTEADEDEDEDATPTRDTMEEDDNSKWYDPNQDQRVRREVRTKIRNNHRDMEAARDELIKPDNDQLLSHIDLGNQYMQNVRQTADAVLDSRFLVSAGELALKKTTNSLRGDATVSLDLDQFVSKCITFMRLGGRTAEEGDEAPTSTQARNRRHTTVADDEDEEEESGDGLDWAVLGALACYPTNRRPPVASFLLGPLSVQKRVRTTQVRRGRSQRQPTGPVTKPQELQVSDIKQSESSNLTHLVKNIHGIMEEHIKRNSEEIESELSTLDEDASEEIFVEACQRRRISLTIENEPCVSLFDFTINPRSFGQTVENLFYVSFLIREGVVRVTYDKDHLPLLIPARPHSVQEHREQNVTKHQAVFSLDWPTWKKLIRAFDIKQPLIPHRESEEASVSAKGWYG